MHCSELTKYFFRIVFITSLITSLSSGLLFSANAAEEAESSFASIQQPLKVGIDPNLPPYTYVDEKRNVTGFEVELIREIL